MKQVDFYLLQNRVNQARFKLASRLCTKLTKLDKRILVITDAAEQTKELDHTMWQHSDTSFLAHDNMTEPAPASPVQIGEHHAVNTAVLERDYDVLVNLCETVPLFNHHFHRIAEIVEAEEDAKIAARKRYKHYQTEGFELKMHKIEL